MLWTKRFKQDSEYQTYIQGDDVIKPNVSVCETEHHVHYNPGPPIDKPDRNRYGVITIGNIEPFNYEGGVETGIALTTNSTNTWALTQKSSWLNVSPNRGTGSTTLTVEADEYTNTDEDREGFFTVRYTMPDARYSTTKYGIIQTKAPTDSKTISTMKILSAGTIVWKTTSTANTKTIEYSKDNGQTWSAITSNTGASAPTISVSEGETLQFRGNNDTYATSTSNYNTFSGSTAVFSVKGNIMSMINSTDYSGMTELVSAYTFSYLFANCTGLTDVSQLILPATSLTNYCYQGMFAGCTSLTNVPALPATTIAYSCYGGMFKFCTSLTTVPTDLLPATNLSTAYYCYQNMFNECYKLTTAPDLPATTLEDNCYAGMFRDCYKLTTAPDLPATTLKTGCYTQMFRSCTSLTETCKFSATTMAGSACTSMFQNCTSLTTAHEIPITAASSNCYSYMFAQCTSLRTAPELPATNLGQWCYSYMFSGCTSLVNPPSSISNSAGTTSTSCCYGMFANCTSLTTVPSNLLPSMSLAQNCYLDMFNGCRSLTNMPNLPANTLANYCYCSMFSGCRSLVNLIPLQASQLSDYCYAGMFQYCYGITSLPNNFLPSSSSLAERCYGMMFYNCSGLTDITNLVLPAMSLATNCYGEMFENCISLTGVSSNLLPATKLSQSCYASMFQGCKNLTTAPDLPAEILPASAYTRMFSGCTKLSYIKCNATNISASNCTSNWVSGVASTGTFVKKEGMNDWTRGVHGIPTNWGVEEYNPTSPYKSQYFTFVALEDGTFKFSGSTSANTLSYSLDNGTTWVALASDTDTPTVQSGATIMWKGTPTPQSSKGIGKFISSGRFNVEGNSMSILYDDSFSGQTSLSSKSYAFYALFSGNTNIVNCNQMMLPATELSGSCYYHMFAGCTSLTTAPELPAVGLKQWCYTDMFGGCTSLTTAPELPATTLAEGCYYGMFSGCTSLTNVPVLPATTLVQTCYAYMFRGCTSLTTVPKLFGLRALQGAYEYMFSDCTGITTVPNDLMSVIVFDGANASNCYRMFAGCTSLTNVPVLPATILATECYGYMFSGCTSLITLPSNMLPATTLKRECYQGMFYGCTNLTGVPSDLLPATTLAERCYSSMFAKCSSLTTAPELPATTLVNSCYSTMFWGCNSLNYVKCLATDISATDCTERWVTNVASSGTFVKSPGMNDWPIDSVNGIPIGWTVKGDYSSVPLTFEITGDGNIIWRASSTAYTCTIEYKKNDGEWTSITSATGSSAPSISVVTGDIVQFRGDNATYSSGYSRYNTFNSTTCQFNVKGNIMSLIDSTDFVTATTLQSADTFRHLFGGTGLTNAENLLLPATTLAQNCYNSMFYGCSSLTTAPELPATTLAQNCYDTMFYGCRSLTTVPSNLLPATTLAQQCYNYMFSGCTNLTTAPELPATTLATECYRYMFLDCTSLTTAPPELPATTLAQSCYEGMFSGCTSLTTAPELPATTLTQHCYDCMFSRCTSLTTAPALPATTLAQNCYSGMFYGCTSLTTAPELPATTLATYCYANMFSNCTSLTTAPELPVTTLTNYCYQSMFLDCTSLNYIKCLATDISATNCTNNWVNGVQTTSGTFVKNPSMTGWTTGTSGIPANWTVEDAT